MSSGLTCICENRSFSSPFPLYVKKWYSPIMTAEDFLRLRGGKPYPRAKYHFLENALWSEK